MTSRCVRSSVGPGFDSVESFFLSLLFFFSSPLSPRLAFLFFPSFFCPLISSSPFPLPSFLFSFYYHFPIRLLSFFTSCFPISAPFLSFLPLYYFPDFFLSSLLSHSFFLFSFFSSLTQNDDFLWFVYSYDRSNWILTDQTNWILIYHFGRLCILPYPLHCTDKGSQNKMSGKI